MRTLRDLPRCKGARPSQQSKVDPVGEQGKLWVLQCLKQEVIPKRLVQDRMGRRKGRREWREHVKMRREQSPSGTPGPAKGKVEGEEDGQPVEAGWTRQLASKGSGPDP